MAKNKNKKPSNDQRVEVNVNELIPYACHFNKSTLLTKNGELLQIIKLTGFTFESVKNEDTEPVTVREAIRKAIAEAIETNNFAIWFHTVRRKGNLAPEGEHCYDFTKQLNKAWCTKHNWENQYTNELYISILIEGESLSIADIAGFFRSLYFPAEIRYRRESLEKSAAELSNVTEKILKSLEEYGAEQLTIYKEDGIYYSGLLNFLGKIINLEENIFPLAMADVSEVLSVNKILFGHNVVEVNSDSSFHLGSIITIKEYHEISTKYTDHFLQLPLEFIVTETFDFVNNKQIIEEFDDKHSLQLMADDDLFLEASGLDAMMKSNTGSPVDFGKHQINIMVTGSTLTNLNENIAIIIDSLSDLGVVAFREDLFMEDCYWAQLPGNFDFIKRLSPTNAASMGGYASLYNFPAGRIDNNHWGAAVTVFYTAHGTPYLFNFHYENNGHTFIIGPFGSGKTVLMNFLVSEAMKYGGKLFFFDQNRGSEIFLRAIGGVYHNITQSPKRTSIRFNPILTVSDNSEGRKFLTNWYEYLLTSGIFVLKNKKHIDRIHEAVNYTFTLDTSDRILSNILPKFWPKEEEEGDAEVRRQKLEEDKKRKLEEKKKQGVGFLSSVTTQEKELDSEIEVENNMSIWYGKGKYAHIFDNAKGEFEPNDHPVYGFDLGDMVKEKIALVPVIFHLLRKIENSLTGEPTILVLDEAWDMLDNYAFSEYIGDWLDRLTAKNAIVIFATESVDGAEKSPMTKHLASKIRTKMFLPNPEANLIGYEEVFGLSKNEYEMLLSMKSKKRQFLLIHDIDAVVAELSLDGLDYEMAVLASRQDTLAMMEGSLAESDSNPDNWLPLFKKRLGE